MCVKKEKRNGMANQTEIIDNILNNLNIAIYVSDLVTNEILFANKALREIYGDSSLAGKVCWEALRNESKRCGVCPIPYLLKNPGKCYQWNLTENEKRVQIYDSIITWPDGRKVHLQYMVDITTQ